jgi:C4-dicarboxylate transporter DctM subunit
MLIALAFCILIFIQTKRRNYASAPLPRWRELSFEEKIYRKKMLREALWALGTPVVILGGIFGGIFTPTEASIVASLYSLLVSMFVYKQVGWKDLPRIFASSGSGAARTMFIVACASLFAWVLNYERIPQTVLNSLTAVSQGPILFMMLLFLIYIVLGMLMDANSILMITIPLFLPLMKSYGLDMVHMGLILQGLLCMGTLSPPFGTLLFAGSYVGGVSVQGLAKELMPFIGIMLLMIILIAIFPQLIMWIV